MAAIVQLLPFSAGKIVIGMRFNLVIEIIPGPSSYLFRLSFHNLIFVIHAI